MRPRSNSRNAPESARQFRDSHRSETRFLEDLESRIKYFLVSGEEELQLEPMNSYKRRSVHKLATEYKLETDSRGEEPERYVCLIKTEAAEAPTGRDRPKLWDFGVQTFSINPGADGVRLMLKLDGSLEIYDEASKHQILHERVVSHRQIRVRKGKIVTPDDADW